MSVPQVIWCKHQRAYQVGMTAAGDLESNLNLMPGSMGRWRSTRR